MKLTKKLLLITSALAMAFAFTACDPDLISGILDMVEETGGGDTKKVEALGTSFTFKYDETLSNTKDFWFTTKADSRFSYKDADGTTQNNCYYRFKFDAKNNWWYLFITNSSGDNVRFKDSYSTKWGTAYIANGRYTDDGNYLSTSTGKVSNGSLVLKTNKYTSWQTVVIKNATTTPSFNITFTGEDSSSTGADISTARAEQSGN